MSWQDTALDPRLLRALGKRGFAQPTPVQASAVPLVLEGKDVVARARTGSGKTLAYLLPALHRILATEANVRGSFKAIILVPTRELCEQVRSEAAAVAQHCGTELACTSLLGETQQQLKRAVATAGQLVVSTPAKLASALRDGLLAPSVLTSRLQMLVLDEADLLLSYGYEEDLQLIAPQVPRSCQCCLMSATVSEDVERLQKLVLHNPVALNLLGGAAGEGGEGAAGDDLAAGSGVAAEIDHFAYTVPQQDKLLAAMAILKLGLIRKKALIFVNTVEQGYRLKLFLESFGVRAALLNAELPLNSRSHILATFNKGLFDYLIATDDVHAPAHDGPAQAATKKGKKRARGQDDAAGKKKRKDEEFGVTRGIDFKGVRTIVNYDLPSSVEGYVHRVGRTGRAGESGSAVTFFGPDDFMFREELEARLAEGKQASKRPEGAASDDEEDEEAADAEAGPSGNGQQAEGAEGSKGKVLRAFTRLTKPQLEALRYRGEDIARSITKRAVKEARARELRAELLNSEKLKDYFEEHAAEKSLLRHDKSLHKTPQAPHLRHVPAYLRDPSIIREKSSTGNRGTAPLAARKRRKLDAAKGRAAGGAPGGAAGASGEDPLKSVAGFVRAPKRGGQHDEELTELEKRAMEAGKKEAKKRAKTQAASAFVPKANVRKQKRRR